MTKLDSAKTNYNEAKTDLDLAKETFFNKLLSDSKPPTEHIDHPITDPVDTQTNSGNPEIGGLEITEEGASIGTGGSTVVNNEGIVQPEQTAAPADNPEAAPVNVPPEEIVNDDEVDQQQNYGVPIVDIGSSNSGSISNDDIRI